MARLVIYLMDIHNWKVDAVLHCPLSNGYQLFGKGHLHDVKLYMKLVVSRVYVGAACIGQTSLRETPYLVLVLFNRNVRVISGDYGYMEEV